ncbi:hypothetical protein [Phytomonospora endophytica]|uniref:Uncharacterized protein n=1 Tax=Phytomonospora endophytica TaxID=714109 RepID=A0A841FAS3_9ACTN|nr:hypothetical protein [Phytomonospora endophytica]MBB6032385.1 hypothetical protein [Phytomonospora endophytica]GIG71401.1 hypothetical protein Pen01_76960 [Phytomonospora endophytica]
MNVLRTPCVSGPRSASRTTFSAEAPTAAASRSAAASIASQCLPAAANGAARIVSRSGSPS